MEVILTVQQIVEQDLPAPIRKDEIESGVELDEFKKGGGYISEELK